MTVRDIQLLKDPKAFVRKHLEVKVLGKVRKCGFLQFRQSVA